MELHEILDLMAEILGWTAEDKETFENADCDLDNLVYETFGVDVETFEKITMSLLLLTPLVVSPLTGTPANAFVHNYENGNMCALLQRKIKETK